ncbi:hypothetical protein HHK36_005150 [Tetracentron sinense]|uniref:RING-CH-type domain-containing protein n=1 Tax=Tetracentron sinense TaxID=13715 RepID=A0A835DM46_TETSI|nr:hypothetical protein HHK36_005150 [Tetracentron sinense]
MGHEIDDQQGSSENSSNPVDLLQHVTTVSSTDLVDPVASENVTVIRSVETESLSGEDGNSKSKAIVMETTKISLGEQKVNVREPERHTCSIDINCGSGSASNINWDAETVCRICHLSSDSASETSDIIQLGCGCKNELGIAHRHCAEAWFKIKGNRILTYALNLFFKLWFLINSLFSIGIRTLQFSEYRREIGMCTFKEINVLHQAQGVIECGVGASLHETYCRRQHDMQKMQFAMIRFHVFGKRGLGWQKKFSYKEECQDFSDSALGPLLLHHLCLSCRLAVGDAAVYAADIFCEICGEAAKNITGVGVNRFMEEWNGRRLAGGNTNSADRRGGCWRGQSFCNFLMACLFASKVRDEPFFASNKILKILQIGSFLGLVKNCCTWTGVHCNNLTSHVIKLQLRNLYNSDHLSVDKFETYERSKLGGEINPSLLEFKQLNYLDISQNDFGGIHIPKFFGSMGSLRYLNLSEVRFEGMIPHQLGNLSNLQYLSLQGPFTLEPKLTIDNLQWLSGLSSLQHLDMSHVNLSKASDWLQVTNMLPFLLELRLSYCELDAIPPLSYVNFTSLSILDLSGSSDFYGSIPNALQNMTSLRVFDVSRDYLNSSIPDSTEKPINLEILDLTGNILSGEIPDCWMNWQALRVVKLGNNNLTGNLPISMGSLSRLISLHLRNNSLSGQIPISLQNCKELLTINLSDNKFSGSIPKWIGKVYQSDCSRFPGKQVQW